MPMQMVHSHQARSAVCTLARRPPDSVLRALGSLASV